MIFFFINNSHNTSNMLYNEQFTKSKKFAYTANNELGSV